MIKVCKNITVLILLLFLVFQGRLNAQNKTTVPTNYPAPTFKRLTIDDGLSQNYPIAIEQDHNGFMWFGTMDGLNKYDGYSFTVYTHNPYDSTTISGNSIKLLFEDSRGMLWIVTYYNDEINLMDTRTELFRRIPFNASNISSIAEDKKGNIWIGTFGAGLFLIEQKNIVTSGFQFTNYKHNPDEPKSLSDNNVRGITVDNDNNLWIGTDSGLEKLSAHGKKAFELYTFYKNVPTAAIENHIHAILNDSDSTMWLCTPKALIIFNRINKQYTVYSQRDKRINSGPRQVAKSRDGNLWISSGPLTVFNVHDKTYYPDYRLPGISNIFSDIAGNIWMGSNAYGVYTYFPESKRFKLLPSTKFKDPSEQSIRTIFEDSEKNLWYIVGAILHKWNRETNELTFFDKPPYVNKLWQSSTNAILEDRNGYVWFDTDRGLCRFNIKSDEPPQFIMHPKRDYPVSGILEDHSGSIWIVGPKYLSKLIDLRTGNFVSYQYNDSSQFGGTNSILEDEQGDIWFTSNLGLIKFNHKSQNFTFYKNNPAKRNSIYINNTTSICPDPLAPEEKLWIGTKGGGLNLFDKRTETFTHILEKDGLPNNTVYGILPDEDGNLWLSTNRGLSKYNPVTKQFTNYDVNDGLQSNEFNTRAFFKSKSGEMFFGGINGLNYFYPKDIFKKDTTAKIVFTDFKLFDKSVSVRDSNSILTKVISETEQIELTHGENQISFEFALLDYYAPAKNQFAYKLEGFNDDWIQLGTKRNVTFTNLDPGEYILKVKGTNSDGIWSENGASLEIIITPPFWQTWWAYSLYVLFALGLLYSIRRYELNRQQWKHGLELETVESIKYKELNRMKSRFFANISHEFRTPLTLILGPAEKINSNSSGEEIEKQKGVIRRNATRLLNLVNQLLDLSRLEAGKLELKASKSNIVSFIKGITMSFESIAEAKDITLKVKSTKDEIELYFDREKMTRIMTNLLSNAFKFTPEGGEITVSINTSLASERHSELVSESASNKEMLKQACLPARQVQHDKYSNLVQMKVRDTGIGITEEELPKLFDRFYQVDSSQTREHEGTGIGLALTKELVELHHGMISVNSKLNEGTEFIIELPVGREHLKDQEIVDHPEILQTKDVILIPDKVGEKNLVIESEESIGIDNVDKTIILIVEDNADVREYIKDSLGNDFQIEEAANGEQGVRKAEKIIPDLIISDIMMPKMDGNQLTRILKNDEKTSHIPIILLTAKSEQESRLEGLETGADDYLTKPFDTKELRIRIKNLINIRRKLQQKYSDGDYLPPKLGEENKLSDLEEQFMCRVMEVIEIHLSEEKFSIEQFGKEVGMSRVQLHRKLKALSGKSASSYLRYVRLSKAKKMIKEDKGNISEIAYSVGFSSPAYFTRCFKEEFGFTPTDLTN